MAAPTECTIEQVVSISEPWESNPAKRTDELLFAGDGRTYKVHRGANDPRPEAGQTLKGWKNENGTFGIAQDRPSGSRGGGKSFDRQPEHPLNLARSLHTATLSSAPQFIEQMLTLSVIDQPKTKDDYKVLVELVADWLKSTYPAEVLARAAPSPNGVSAEAPAAATADESIPF